MHIFSILVEHARAHPDAVAMQCAQRITSYRKLNSRIERATARLQGEWRIRPGDLVAYCGAGHQDAVVLYFALLRCSADLLVMPANTADIATTLSRHQPTLLLNDSGEPVASPTSGLRTYPLHTIIATRCHHQVADIPRQAANRLLRVATDGSAATFEIQSSDALFARIKSRCDAVRIDAGRIFDDAVFAPMLLSCLSGGGMVHIE